MQCKSIPWLCFLFIYLLTLFNVNYKTLAAHALIKIDVFQNRCQACNFIKMRLQHRCFPMKFTKSLRTPFLQNTSTLMAATGSKQCKPMKTHTESLCCWEKKWYTRTVLLRLAFLGNEYSSEFFQTLLAEPHLVALHEKAESSCPGVFCKKDVFENFANQRSFPVNFAKFSRIPFFIEHLRWLLLKAKSRNSCSIKKAFFEILPNSQENTCARVSFLQS